ncbi:MAG: bacillithiol biosynthesis BshC, partial [Deltaproteobacteria bacterium]
DDAVTPLDAGFARVVKRAEGAVEQQLGRVADRARRAVAEADAVRVSRVDRLRALCWPGDAPQERVFGFPWFGARHGPRALVDALLAAAEPWNPDLVEVDPL